MTASEYERTSRILKNSEDATRRIWMLLNSVYDDPCRDTVESAVTKIISESFLECDAFAALMNDVGDWHVREFGADCSNKRIARKLLEEAAEFSVAPDDAVEAADVLICLMAWAHRNKKDLIAEARKKFYVVRQRDQAARDTANGLPREYNASEVEKFMDRADKIVMEETPYDYVCIRCGGTEGLQHPLGKSLCVHCRAVGVLP